MAQNHYVTKTKRRQKSKQSEGSGRGHDGEAAANWRRLKRRKRASRFARETDGTMRILRSA